MLNIGPQELLIILVIALIVVGPQRLPGLARSIGRGLRELRKAQDEVRRTIRVNLDDDGSSTATKTRAASEGPPVSRQGDGDRRSDSSAPAGEDGPGAGDPVPADEVREISRSLGRSLAELRRAREEVQRSFRTDMSAPTATSPASEPSARRSPPLGPDARSVDKDEGERPAPDGSTSG